MTSGHEGGDSIQMKSTALSSQQSKAFCGQETRCTTCSKLATCLSSTIRAPSAFEAVWPPISDKMLPPTMESFRGGRGADICQVFLKVRGKSQPEHCGCLLVLREMVPRGHGVHLPLPGEVQGQDDHEHADAGRGSDGGADQHDQHSMAVSVGMVWEGWGRVPGLNKIIENVTFLFKKKRERFGKSRKEKGVREHGIDQHLPGL